MDWSDEGIVLSTRRHGENGSILELFTPHHGRHMGLVRGGASRRLRGTLQPGNSLRVTWRARLSEHLGSYTIELQTSRAGGLMENAFALAGLSAACAVARIVPEREGHGALYKAFEVLLDCMGDEDVGADVWPAIFVRWELGLLQEMGFGLDLARCAATGTREDLIYVSPRSGRAVSRAAGEAYKDRLFHLPGFLIGSQAGDATPAEVLAGFRLTGHFLERHLFGASLGHLPDARARLGARLEARVGESVYSPGP